MTKEKLKHFVVWYKNKKEVSFDTYEDACKYVEIRLQKMASFPIVVM